MSGVQASITDDTVSAVLNNTSGGVISASVAKAPNATKERNAALKNVIAATRKIGGVGVLAFASDAATRAEFEALLAGTSHTKKKTPPAP